MQGESKSAPTSRIAPVVWYLPTFHGDILLERKLSKDVKGRVVEQTTMRVFDLTPMEETALASLRMRAVSPTWGRRSWCTAIEFAPVMSAQYRTKEGLVITFDAKIEDVEAVLARAMKPKRKLLSAVRFSDGCIEEVRRVPGEDGDVARLEPPHPCRSGTKEVRDKVKESEEGSPKEVPSPIAAVTAAKPTIGCPMPGFPEADVRASRVLEAFLVPDQIRDYRCFGSFVATGADTGHRYLVANRETRQAIEQCSGRQLYDLDEQRAICVHDWDVPPAEEMLAIFLCLTLPGHEGFIRTLPEAFAS